MLSLRKLCENCKVPYEPTREEQAGIQASLGIEAIKRPSKGIQFFRGKGCEECGGDGYRGRIGVFEVLETSSEIRDAMLQDKPTEELQAIAIKQGMRTMAEDGLEKALKGMTSIEEVLRVTKADE